MGIYDNIFHELGLTTNANENSILKNLTRKPRKEPKKVMPHTTASKIYSTEQIDSLYMPNDNGYKYILVVVDIATRLMDAEPMKDREAKTTVKALEKIYKRKIVQRPLFFFFY